MRDVMSHFSFETLALSGEPALVFRQGRLVYCNPPAETLLDHPAPGSSFSDLFGLPQPEGNAALSPVSLHGRSWSLRLNPIEDETLVFLSALSDGPLSLSDPLLVLLRDIQVGISLSADRIREEAEAEENAGILENTRVLTRNQFRLNRIVGNAAVASNLLAGRQPFHPRLCDPAQLCRAVLEALRFMLPRLQLEEHIETELLFPLDAALFKQLLLNLIANSLDAGSDRIALYLRREKELLLLSLCDNGSGIAPEELPLVFDRFRHEAELDRMRRGAGLGLTVSRGIAELHGGALLLESPPGQGTTVRVSFRRSPEQTESLLLPEDPLPGARELLTGLAEHLPAELFDTSLLD